MNKTFLVIALFLFSACDASANDNDEIIFYSPGCHLPDYTPAKDSIYVLPYPVGKEYAISQGNCGQYTHTKDTGVDVIYSYDFAMLIGDKITAARGGVVINMQENFSNHSNFKLHTNWIAIKHDDGTIANYLHLTKNGVLVEIGDEIKQGDVIGIAGSSGYTMSYPHLHFHVTEKEHEACQLNLYKQADESIEYLQGCKTIPITFKNAEPLDTPLRYGESYKAVEF